MNQQASNPKQANQLGWPDYKAMVGDVFPNHIDKGLSQFEKCILGIDLGARNLKGPRLEACAEWISKNFKSCAVAIADSAHQYTLQLTLGLSQSSAHEEALRCGQEFIETYRPIFEKHAEKCSFDFSLLSKLRESANYQSDKDLLNRLHENHTTFSQSAETFAQKYPQSLGISDQLFNELAESTSRQQQLAVSHLIDELAMFACLKQDGWPILIYPGMLTPLQEIIEGKHPDVPESLKSLVFTHLRLQREKVYFMAETADKEEELPESFEFLSDLSNDEWEKFITHTKGKSFKANDVLIEYGQDDRSMYILAQGKVDVFLHDPKDGSQKKINTLDKGTVFGELALLDGKPRSASVVASTDGLIFQLSFEDFSNLKNDDPNMACALLFDIGRVLSLRNRHMNEVVQNAPSV